MFKGFKVSKEFKVLMMFKEYNEIKVLKSSFSSLCSLCSLCRFVNCVIGLRVNCTLGIQCIDSALGIHCDRVAHQVFKVFKDLKVL